jgi:hypothetical protein
MPRIVCAFSFSISFPSNADLWLAWFASWIERIRGRPAGAGWQAVATADEQVEMMEGPHR